MAFAFEKLIVYQRAIAFADNICAMTEKFPRGYGFLSDQLNRACVSIATNLAEANGRFTKADRKNFFTIARGSVQECVPLIELACRRNLITEAEHSQFRSELEIIGKMLSGLINGLENRMARLRYPEPLSLSSVLTMCGTKSPRSSCTGIPRNFLAATVTRSATDTTITAMVDVRC